MWGTKFKFFGGNSHLPANIGQIVYKTSLFHLQPRKMTIVLDDLSKQHAKRTQRNESNVARRNFSKEKKEAKSSKKPVSSSFLDSVTKLKCGDLEKRTQRHGDASSIRSVSLYSLNDADDDELSINLNDTVATAHDLVDKKLKIAQYSELPVLKLANHDSAQSYCEYDADYADNQCLIVSTTLNDQPTSLKSAVTMATPAAYISPGPRFASEHLPHTSSRHVKYSNDSIMFTRNSNTLLSRLNSEFAFLNYLRTYRNSLTLKSLSNRFARKNIQIEEEANDELNLVNNIHADSSQKRADHTDDAEDFFEEEHTVRKRTKSRVKAKNKRFVLHNKPPIWNETSQVYQLDFGGRVTQESAKNFQVEYAGKQVMQFGRIDSNAYTLDFEWPFTTVQAFSIALANITQRLK
jgi:hypothetical protein